MATQLDLYMQQMEQVVDGGGDTMKQNKMTARLGKWVCNKYNRAIGLDFIWYNGSHNINLYPYGPRHDNYVAAQQQLDYMFVSASELNSTANLSTTVVNWTRQMTAWLQPD
jgi:hypothetical protein